MLHCGQLDFNMLHKRLCFYLDVCACVRVCVRTHMLVSREKTYHLLLVLDIDLYSHKAAKAILGSTEWRGSDSEDSEEQAKSSVL